MPSEIARAMERVPEDGLRRRAPKRPAIPGGFGDARRNPGRGGLSLRVGARFVRVSVAFRLPRTPLRGRAGPCGNGPRRAHPCPGRPVAHRAAARRSRPRVRRHRRHGASLGLGSPRGPSGSHPFLGGSRTISRAESDGVMPKARSLRRQRTDRRSRGRAGSGARGVGPRRSREHGSYRRGIASPARLRLGRARGHGPGSLGARAPRAGLVKTALLPGNRSGPGRVESLKGRGVSR